MPLKVWNGSSWEVQAQLKVWNGSSWVSTNALNNAKSARVWNGSSWVQFHPGVRIDESGTPGGGIDLNASDLTFSPTSANAQASIEIASNGTMTYATNLGSSSYTWLLSGSNSDYYAYMDAPSGDPFSQGTTGTSLQLNTTRFFSLDANVSGSPGVDYKTLTSTLRIKNSAGTDILSCAVSLTAIAEMQP